MFEELDDDELISVMQFWDRVACAAAATQLAAIAELARRRPRSFPEDGPAGHVDAGDPLVPEISEFAVDEIAAALRLSRPAAGARLHVAVELTRLPAVTDALAAGALDVPKARAVVDAVAVLDAPTAAAVCSRILPRAGQQTVGQLRASLLRAVLAADPAAAEVRHEKAVASRQVTLQPARDGMAELWALLPADAAVAIYQRIDAAARTGPADGRAMDARRADALVTAVLGQTQPTAATVHITVPAAGSAVLGQVRPSPGKVHVTVPSETAVGPGSTVAGQVRPTAASVRVTVPAETARGLGEEPGELAGFGPVPGSMARRLAIGAPWRKATTDPAGAVIDVGRTAYSPSAALADLVRARDVTCRFPGCRQPAHRCDLDHLVPWPAGPTTAANLAALCRHHHRLKHQTRWTVRAGPGAELTWTAPTGRAYSTAPP